MACPMGEELLSVHFIADDGPGTSTLHSLDTNDGHRFDV